MNDCTTCQFDTELNCLQGHIRRLEKFGGESIPIENCHAYKEKEKCWCEYGAYARNPRYFSKGSREFAIKFCPECGRKLS